MCSYGPGPFRHPGNKPWRTYLHDLRLIPPRRDVARRVKPEASRNVLSVVIFGFKSCPADRPHTSPPRTFWFIARHHAPLLVFLASFTFLSFLFSLSSPLSRFDNFQFRRGVKSEATDVFYEFFLFYVWGYSLVSFFFFVWNSCIVYEWDSCTVEIIWFIVIFVFSINLSRNVINEMFFESFRSHVDLFGRWRSKHCFVFEIKFNLTWWWNYWRLVFITNFWMK